MLHKLTHIIKRADVFLRDTEGSRWCFFMTITGACKQKETATILCNSCKRGTPPRGGIMCDENSKLLLFPSRAILWCSTYWSYTCTVRHRAVQDDDSGSLLRLIRGHTLELSCHMQVNISFRATVGVYYTESIHVCPELLCSLVSAVNSNHTPRADKQSLLPPTGAEGCSSLLIYSSSLNQNRLKDLQQAPTLVLFPHSLWQTTEYVWNLMR